MDTRYECQACGAVSEDERDALARVCRLCGLWEREAWAVVRARRAQAEPRAHEPQRAGRAA